MNSEKVNCPIVLASDEAYAMPLATTLRSIVEANQGDRPYNFYVLYDEFSEITQKKVIDSLPKGSAYIHWILVDIGLFGEFTPASHISKMTYARFLIPQIFTETVSRVLYLDADLLILDDLDALWETDLEGYVLGAVMDALDPRLKGSEEGFRKILRLEEVPRVMNYFNAGVLLIDLKQWRKERISERALEYLAQNPMSPFSDQDALNVACDGLWLELESRWNFQDHYRIRISELDPELRPKIAHFVTSLKPWKPSSMSVNALLYDNFRSRTCFARTPREKLRETFVGSWYRFKRFLWQYAFFRSMRDCLKSICSHKLIS
jgi:lipopolysaccharide biosynthesis glycosyltransferase